MPVETKRDEIEYSWDGARGAWDDNNDTWDTAVYEQYVVTAGEVIASAELRKSKLQFVRKNTVAIGEKTLKQAAHLAKEDFSFADVVRTWLTLGAVIQEALNILDKASFASSKTAKENIAAIERLYSDADFNRLIAENIAAGEHNSNMAIINAAEALAIAEDYLSAVYRIFYENIAVNADIARQADFNRVFRENLNIVGKIGIAACLNVLEVLATAEVVLNLAHKQLKETVAAKENARQVAAFRRIMSESVAVEEAIKRTRNRVFKVALQIAERTAKSAAIKEKESFRVQSQIWRESLLAFKEKTLLISESYKKQGNFVMAEQIELLSQKIGDISRTPFVESFDISDAAGHAHTATREFEAEITINSLLKEKSAEKRFDELLKLYDAIVEACQAILSDLRINNGSITLEDFEKIVKTVPGYLPFMDFKVGEYDYKDALVRIAIGSSVAQTEPSIYNAIMHVDIPDTQDRGTTEIENTSAATQVYFNKSFYNPPEVSVNLRGGNTGDGIVVPNLVSTDKKDEYGRRYFEVELLNSKGQRVAGLITWQAVGY